MTGAVHRPAAARTAVAAAALAALTAVAGCGAAAKTGPVTPALPSPLLTVPAYTPQDLSPATPTPASSTPARTAVAPPMASSTPAAPAPAPVPAHATASGSGSLAGKTVVIDPGHNGGNFTAPAQIARQVPDGNGTKECDTTGTETGGGYTEATFNFAVAQRMSALLTGRGARVVLTRESNTGVGPCVDARAAAGAAAHADVALSIHADGGPAGGYGFHVIEPAPVAGNTAIVGPSAALGRLLHDTFHSETGEPYATYIGSGDGYSVRGDLGGLNLSAVPKVFIECGNMRNAADASRLVTAGWQQLAAQALADAVSSYLTAQ